MGYWFLPHADLNSIQENVFLTSYELWWLRVELIGNESMFSFSTLVHISAVSAHRLRFLCTARARQSRRPIPHLRLNWHLRHWTSCLQALRLAVLSCSIQCHCSEIHGIFSCHWFASLEAPLLRQSEGKRRRLSTPCDSWLFSSDTKRRLNCGKIMERLFILENPKSSVNIWHNIDGVSSTSEKIAAMWSHTAHSETKGTHTDFRTFGRSFLRVIRCIAAAVTWFSWNWYIFLIIWRLSWLISHNCKNQQRFQNFSCFARYCRQSRVVHKEISLESNYPIELYESWWCSGSSMCCVHNETKEE